MSEAYKLAVIRSGDVIAFRSNKTQRIVRAQVEGFRTEYNGKRLVLFATGTVTLDRIISRTRPHNLSGAETIVFEQEQELAQERT